MTQLSITNSMVARISSLNSSRQAKDAADTSDSGRRMSEFEGRRVFAFSALVIIQLATVVTYKTASNMGLTFSPASTLVLSEFIKFIMSSGLFWHEGKAAHSTSVSTKTVLVLFLLALIYSINNQLTFWLLRGGHLTTFTMFKSSSLMLTAVFRSLFLKGTMDKVQMCCLVLQCCFVTLFTHDDCKDKAVLSSTLYLLNVLACILTALSSTLNEQVVKAEDVSVNALNAVLYFFGMTLNYMAYATLSLSVDPVSGFFEGYNWLVLLIVLLNSFVGLAVTMVYKYADAVVKTFAQSLVNGMVLFISWAFFNHEVCATGWLAALGLVFNTYIYLDIASHLPERPKTETSTTISLSNSRTRSKIAATIGIVALGVSSYILFFSNAGTIGRFSAASSGGSGGRFIRNLNSTTIFSDLPSTNDSESSPTGTSGATLQELRGVHKVDIAPDTAADIDKTGAASAHVNASASSAAAAIAEIEPAAATAAGDKRIAAAVCIAGAWRRFELSWPTMQKNLVAPLDADVYVVTDSFSGGINDREAADTTVTPERIRAAIGPRLQACAVNSQADYPEMVRKYPFLRESESFKTYPYMVKIWQCSQMLLRSNRTYDIIAKARPDLIVQLPFEITRVLHPPPVADVAAAAAAAAAAAEKDPVMYRLRVGGTEVAFGERAVVINSFTYKCGNDWFAIGPAPAMIVTMDAPRFFTRRAAWFSPNRDVASFIETTGGGMEYLLDWLWWRTGTTVHRWPLYIEMARSNCFHPGCLRVDTFSHARVPAVGSISWDDCTAAGGRDDLDWLTLPAPSSPAEAAATAAPAAAAAGGGAGGGGHWFPDCKDVEDLSVLMPLRPCRSRSGGPSESRTPGRHKVRVLRGYGTPVTDFSRYRPAPEEFVRDLGGWKESDDVVLQALVL